jgi:hypothetical protein
LTLPRAGHSAPATLTPTDHGSFGVIPLSFHPHQEFSLYSTKARD